jgi:hypothetical protein
MICVNVSSSLPVISISRSISGIPSLSRDWIKTRLHSSRCSSGAAALQNLSLIVVTCLGSIRYDFRYRYIKKGLGTVLVDGSCRDRSIATHDLKANTLLSARPVGLHSSNALLSRRRGGTRLRLLVRSAPPSKPDFGRLRHSCETSFRNRHLAIHNCSFIYKGFGSVLYAVSQRYTL